MQSRRSESAKLSLRRTESIKPKTINFIILEESISEDEKCCLIKEILQKKTAPVSARYSMFSGETNLHLAVKKNLIKVATLLIEAAADINAIDDHERKPLHYAMKKNNPEMVALLLRFGALMNTQEATQFLIEALQKKSTDLAIILIQSGMNINRLDAGNRSPLYYAASLGLEKALLWLCCYEADWTLGENPLQQAVINNHPKAVAILMSVARPEHAPLITTAKTCVGQLPITAAQAMYTAFSSPKRNLNLHDLVKEKAWDALLHYVADGLPVNRSDDKGCTPIHYATARGYSEMLLFLCQHSEINLNVLDNKQESILHKCVRNREIKSIKIIVTAGKMIDRYLQNTEGKRAEDLIADSDHMEGHLRQALADFTGKKKGEDFYQAYYRFKPDDERILKVMPTLLNKFNLLELAKLENLHAVPRPSVDGGFLSTGKQVKINFNKEMCRIQENLQKILLGYGLDQVFPVSETRFITEEDFIKIIAQRDKNPEKYPDNNINIEGLKIIYQLCKGEKTGSKVGINIQYLQFSSIGLCTYYTLPMIISALTLLSPWLNNYQHLAAHYLLFNAMNTAQALNFSPLSFEKSLHFYTRYCCLREIGELFNQAFSFMKNLYASKDYADFKQQILLEMPQKKQSDMQDIIQKIIAGKSKIPADKVEYIAEEICQLNFGFYQKTPFDSFIRENKIITAGNRLTNQSELTDVLAAFIYKLILQQKTPKLRAKVIALFTLVAKQCFHSAMGPDLHSFLAIITVLTSSKIDRLKATMAYMSKKHPRIFELYQALSTWVSDDQSNYIYSRVLMEKYPKTLAHFSYYRKEIIMMSESTNKADNLYFLGQLYKRLIDLRQSLEFFQYTNGTNLFFELLNLDIPDEESLWKMVFLAEPKTPELCKNYPLGEFEVYLKHLKEYKLPLKVIYDSKTWEDKNALPVIKMWLKKVTTDKPDDIQKGNYLYSICKIISGSSCENSPIPKRSSLKLGLFNNSGLPLSPLVRIEEEGKKPENPEKPVVS